MEILPFSVIYPSICLQRWYVSNRIFVSPRQIVRSRGASLDYIWYAPPKILTSGCFYSSILLSNSVFRRWVLRKAVVRRDSFQGSQFAIKGQGNELYQVQIDIPSIVTCIQDGSSDYGFYQVLLQLEVTCISEPDVGSVLGSSRKACLHASNLSSLKSNWRGQTMASYLDKNIQTLSISWFKSFLFSRGRWRLTKYCYSLYSLSTHLCYSLARAQIIV